MAGTVTQKAGSYLYT